MHSSTKLKANIISDNTGKLIELPVIITREGVLKSYLKYLLNNRFKSQSWISKSVFSVRLLLDYVDANQYTSDNPRDLFREFVTCLYAGTVGDDCYDPSGLFWQARESKDAEYIVILVTHFSDWLAAENDGHGIALNPYRSASPYEEKLNWTAYLQKRDRAFLSHLWKHGEAVQRNAITRSVVFRRKVQSLLNVSEPMVFPRKKTNDLLFNGFVLPGKSDNAELHERINIRNVLITILMQFGGLRISETAHIFVEDISELSEPARLPLVKVYDPVNGTSPYDKNVNRKKYLWRQFGLSPRNEYPVSSKQFAGWKSPLLTNPRHRYFTVLFFPSAAGELFLELWKLYLIYQRTPPPATAKHPYAFTSRNGAPYSIKAYTEARKRAVIRIGLTYSKDAGTTPHGDRHRYGRNLAESNVPPLLIKTAMHHCSLDSQNTYTQPSDGELRKRLADAEKNALEICNFQKLRTSVDEK